MEINGRVTIDEQMQSQDMSQQPIAGFSEYLAPGEGVVAFADGLVRETGITFDKCKIVLTRYRLIIIKQGWPWGYKVDRTLPRSECRVLKDKERFDGSELLIIEHDSGPVCLYFGRHDREVAHQVRDELGGIVESARTAGSTDVADEESSPAITATDEPRIIEI